MAKPLTTQVQLKKKKKKLDGIFQCNSPTHRLLTHLNAIYFTASYLYPHAYTYAYAFTSLKFYRWNYIPQTSNPCVKYCVKIKRLIFHSQILIYGILIKREKNMITVWFLRSSRAIYQITFSKKELISLQNYNELWFLQYHS